MPSNVENILNAILTGDGSGIQKPASRVEELLFEIYEQGGGGGGDSVIGGIKLTIDENYVMTVTLVDKDGEEYGVSDDIDLPLEEMVVDAEYDPQTQKIKLELKNGNYVEFSVAELVSGLQTELNSSNKLNPAYIDYDASHRAVSDTEKNTWNAKQNAISDLEAIRSGASAGATAVQPATMSEALAAKQDTISDLAAIRSGATAGATAVQPETMSTALALKQDSLSEAQLAAVNSGINSTKVAQIETNKANILYSLNTGVKNICNPYTWILGYYLKPEDGSLIPYPGDNGITSDFIPVDYSSEDYYYISGLQNDGNTLYNVIHAFNASKQFLGRTDGTLDTTRNVYESSFTGGTPVGTGDIAYIRITQYGTSGNVKNIDTSLVMVCTGHAKEQSVAHQLFALPNTDLTVREAEDRAALAEQVDEGAKNIVDISKAYASDYGNVSIDTNTNSVTVSGTHAWAKGNIVISVKPNTTYAIKYRISANTSTVQSSLTVTKGDTSDTYYSHIIASGTTGTFTGEFTTDANASIAVVKITANSTNSEIATAASITISELMICTLADWKVSQNYAPYRKSLDQLEATKAPALDTGAGVDSGSLDDISENTFAIYTTNVSNLPTATSYYYVETSVFNSSSALQRAYDTGNGESYVRVKYQGTWQAWKQITNA